MITVTLTNGTKGTGTIKQFKETFDYVDNQKYQTGAIERLTATGESLEFIHKKFINIPITVNSCTWRGEMAQFIFDNL